MTEKEKVHVFKSQEQDPTIYQRSGGGTNVKGNGRRFKNKKEWEDYWQLCELLEIEEREWWEKHNQDNG